MPVKVMIMQDSADMRSTHILDRGNYDAPTTEVSPFMPDFIFPFDSSKFEQNRLGLAKWLLADEHPLTARVFVNRIWQEIFGTGIVKSSGDFGMQGDITYTSAAAGLSISRFPGIGLGHQIPDEENSDVRDLSTVFRSR